MRSLLRVHYRTHSYEVLSFRLLAVACAPCFACIIELAAVLSDIFSDVLKGLTVSLLQGLSVSCLIFLEAWFERLFALPPSNRVFRDAVG